MKTFLVNKKAMYAHFATLTKVRSGITNLILENGTITDSTEAANALAATFQEVYTPPQMQLPTNALGAASSSTAPIPDFSVQNVQRKLEALLVNKSAGLDNLSPRILKECTPSLASPLSNLFQKSYDRAEIPLEWKKGIITPLHKGGSRSSPGNYRPIALLSVVSKVMESIVENFIRKVLEARGRLIPQQHGFREGRSCLTNLLNTADSWTAAIDSGDKIDVIYLDFAKAFDRVDHSILLSKLRSFDLPGGVLEWLTTYLQNMSYYVRIHSRSLNGISVQVNELLTYIT